MESEFSNLLLDFGTIMDALGATGEVATRRAMLHEANAVLSKARAAWQSEMKLLRVGIQNLHDARMETMKLATQTHETELISQLGFSERHSVMRG